MTSRLPPYRMTAKFAPHFETEEGDGAVLYDGFDLALIGFADVWDSSGMRVTRAVYAGEKIQKILIDRDKLTWEEAMEHIDFNVDGGYLGPATPIVVWGTD